jgi:hypothetical protein
MSKCKLKQVHYPDYLSWFRLAKVIKIGAEITNSAGEVFIVQERLVSATYGAEPRLNLIKKAADGTTELK